MFDVRRSIHKGVIRITFNFRYDNGFHSRTILPGFQILIALQSGIIVVFFLANTMPPLPAFYLSFFNVVDVITHMGLSFQSLKFKIALNLAVIILLSVVLTDFVAVYVIQKQLIARCADQGQSALALLPDDITLFFPDGSVQNQPITVQPSLAPVSHVFVLAGDTAITVFGDGAPWIEEFLETRKKALIHQASLPLEYYGTTFGVFWQQKKYLILSQPLTGPEGDAVAGVKIALMDLEPIYATLRDAHKLIGFYVLGNSFLILLFGLYRLSRLIVRPIHRFIKMTDNFREKDRFYFTYGTRHQEFKQLSTALNHMVDTIEADREHLRRSLDELETANRELKTAQREVVRAEKLASVGRLSAGIAHEIGNPIGIVLGYLDLLKSRPGMKTDDAGQDFVKRAQGEINRINQVIRQLLDFSRSTPVDVKKVALHTIVREVVQMMSCQPLLSEIAIHCRLDGQAADRVEIDQNQFRQVLINLIINAADSIKASLPREEPGKIIIASCNIAGDAPAGKISAGNISAKDAAAGPGRLPALVLTIADNGIGISPQDINYVFDPFFTTKDPGKGTGLGLSVSYMIIDKAGGHISMDSTSGKGTTVSIVLPLCREP